MADAVIDFRCESCGQGYRVKPELAGKKIKCKCGGVMRVPQPAAADDIVDLDDIGVEEEPAYRGDPCPSCGASLAPNAVLCVQCGFNVKTGAKVDAAATGSGGVGGASTMILVAKIVNWIFIGLAALSMVGSFMEGTIVGGLFGLAIQLGAAYSVIQIVGNPPGTTGTRVTGYICNAFIFAGSLILVLALGWLKDMVESGQLELSPADREMFLDLPFGLLTAMMVAQMALTGFNLFVIFTAKRWE